MQDVAHQLFQRAMSLKASTDPRDADGDGIVDEGKPSERPANKTAFINEKVLNWARAKFRDEQVAANFAAWFADSKVFDENGQPKVVYHGTWNDFTEFDREHGYKLTRNKPKDSIDAIGVWFTDKHETARKSYGPKVIESYVKIRKPFVIHGESGFEKLKELSSRKGGAQKMRQWMIGAGYDGIVMPEAKLDRSSQHIVIPFEPSQIKSATNNKGTFRSDSRDFTE